MPEKKSDIVRKLIAEKDYRKALCIAKDFRLGISEDDSEAMKLGYACMTNTLFYRQIGTDTDAAIKQGIDVLVRLYG